MRNNTNVARARTVLTKNGIRVNWRNVGYFTIEKQENSYLIEIRWKYKAGIMTEKIEMGDHEFKPTSYFRQFQLIPLTEDTYINLNNVMIIEEQSISGPVEKVLVRVVLIDGYQVIVKMTRERWVWWKQNYS